MTSMAARIALDLDLPVSYAKLSALSFDSSGDERDESEEERLMRESRVWFGTFILENILSIDCGKKPGIKAASGAGMRRCRVLLGHRNRTTLDFRMLSQVEASTSSGSGENSLLTMSCIAELNSRYTVEFFLAAMEQLVREIRRKWG